MELNNLKKMFQNSIMEDKEKENRRNEWRKKKRNELFLTNNFDWTNFQILDNNLHFKSTNRTIFFFFFSIYFHRCVLIHKMNLIKTHYFIFLFYKMREFFFFSFLNLLWNLIVCYMTIMSSSVSMNKYQTNTKNTQSD